MNDPTRQLHAPAGHDHAAQRRGARFDGVICFGGEDWWYHNRGHFDMQLMRRLSAAMPVLYVNSIGMRTPTPSEGRMFLHRVGRKLRSLRRGFVSIEPRFAVLSPIAMPDRLGLAVTRPLLAATVRRAARRLGMSRPLLWIACPTAAEVVQRLEHAALIYQRTDRFEDFRGRCSQRIAGYDDYLKSRADLTVFCSRWLMDREAPHCRRACLVDHGVDVERFAGAVADGVEPAEIAPLARPRVGFVGSIDAHSFDPALMKDVAARLPAMSFVLVGPCSLPAGWCGLPNVHLVGQRRLEDVPAYMACCDVLIMPWNRSPWIDACNPVKLKEYLASGRPIVSTPFGELRHYDGLVKTAGDAETFASAISAAVRDPGDESARRARVADESWAAKLGLILGHLAEQGIRPQRDSAVPDQAPQRAAAHAATGQADTASIPPKIHVRPGTERESGASTAETTTSAKPPGRAAEADRLDPPDIAAAIVLAGGLRQPPLVVQTRQSILDLFLTPRQTVLDCWIDRIGELAAAGVDQPAIRVVHDGNLPAPWPGQPSDAAVFVEKDPKPYRGPAGVVRDLCRGYRSDQHVLVVEGARYLSVPLGPLVADHAEKGAEVTVVSNADGSPAGLYLIRCGTLELAPGLGYVDLKEQWLQRVQAVSQRVCVHRLASHGAMPLRTAEEFLAAARVANAGSGGQKGIGETGSFQVICPGSLIGPGATVVDSIVMPSAVIGANALVVRSLLCPHSRVQPGTDIADAVLVTGGCPTTERLLCA